MNLQDIDLQKLTEEQAKDIKEIEQLQKQVEEMAANLTLGDVTNIEDMLAARPSVKKSRSSKQTLKNLQYEIEKYQKEIELVKIKLQFKQ